MPLFSQFCVFFLVISLFKMAVKWRAKELSRVPKSNKAPVRFTDKIRVSEKLHLILSF